MARSVDRPDRTRERRAALDHRFVQPLVLIYDHVRREACLAIGSNTGAIDRRERSDRGDRLLDGAARETVDAVSNHLGHAAPRERDDRRATRARLRQYDAERVLP